MTQFSLPELPMDPVPIDVRALVQKTVATLYSNLVTRPTGRAVRLAIEAQLSDRAAPPEDPALSMVDLSAVTILDFSCADEVVARLLARYRSADRPRNAYFVFTGVSDLHKDPIETVLKRQDLVTVAETAPDRYELLGALPEDTRALWHRIETATKVLGDDLTTFLNGPAERILLDDLIDRRLVVHLGPHHGVRALSVVAMALKDES